MVDEVHERSVATDVLLGLLKKVQKVRKDLRVVISSATMQAKVLATFFDTGSGDEGPPAVGAVKHTPCIMSVEGRTHDVQVLLCVYLGLLLLLVYGWKSGTELLCNEHFCVVHVCVCDELSS